MAQLSYNTIFYDQLILKVRSFLIKYNNNEFSSYQELANEYNELISDISNYSGSPVAKYDPYIKGEPASSEKINRFISEVAKDLNIVAKQIDYQSGQIVSIYNLFNTELDKESQFMKRINSKIAILQMYSNSPANDIYYLGDSFDNYDFIDVTKINSNNIPNVSSGSFKLGIRNTTEWKSNFIEIDQAYSNGFIGNNHSVFSTQNILSNTKYYFEENDKIGYIPNIIDQSPLTYFDYEAINIPRISRTNKGAKDFEFLYTKEIVNNDKKETAYVSWADHQDNTPLRLGIIISSPVAQKINSLTIVPNLGNSTQLNPEIKVVKVSAIDASTNAEVTLNNSGLYIGSTIVPQTIESRRNYFYQTATIDFPEITTSKIIIHFEQSNYQDVSVKHLYWKPVGQTSTSLFANSNRFNPDVLLGQGYDSVNYNFSTLVPEIKQPNKFKILDNINPQINVTARKLNVQTRKYVVKFERDGLTKYLKEMYPSSFAPIASQYEATAAADVRDAIYFSTQTEAEAAKLFIQSQLVGSGAVSIIYSWDPTKFENLIVQEHIQQADENFSENVRLQKNYELYAAKRWSISIKSIQGHYNVFQNTGSIVSKPFEFPYNVKNVSLSVEAENNLQGALSADIKYSVSVDDGNSWIQISPIENPFSGSPEIISFNENIFGTTQLPGVSYLNYPQVPKQINKVRVKIDTAKKSGSNYSPIIYSYKLCAKVEQL